jgi:uncharacterized membrane protein YfhO
LQPPLAKRIIEGSNYDAPSVFSSVQNVELPAMYQRQGSTMPPAEEQGLI